MDYCYLSDKNSCLIYTYAWDVNYDCKTGDVIKKTSPVLIHTDIDYDCFNGLGGGGGSGYNWSSGSDNGNGNGDNGTGGGGGGSNACSPFSNAYMIVTDTKNPNRHVSGDTPLVMVEGNENRRAQFSIVGCSTIPWVKWSYGENHGTTLTFDTSLSADIYPYQTNSTILKCKTLNGNVKIIGENSQNRSSEITLMKNKISTIKSVIEGGLHSLTKNNDANFELEFDGSVSSKNVDKYADGTNFGNYYECTIGLKGTINLPSFSSPDIEVYPGVYANATMDIGNITGSGSINGSYDDSKINTSNITGQIKVELLSPSFRLNIYTGIKDVCEAGLDAKASIPKISYIGDILGQSKNLILRSNFNLTPITCSGNIYVKFLDTISCKKELVSVTCSNISISQPSDVVLMSF